MNLMALFDTAVQIYIYAIIVRVLLSWFPLPSSGILQSAYKALYDVTEPYLGLFRRIMPSFGRGGMGIDISPMIAILALYALRNFLRGVF